MPKTAKANKKAMKNIPTHVDSSDEDDSISDDSSISDTIELQKSARSKPKVTEEVDDTSSSDDEEMDVPDEEDDGDENEGESDEEEEEDESSEAEYDEDEMEAENEEEKISFINTDSNKTSDEIENDEPKAEKHTAYVLLTNVGKAVSSHKLRKLCKGHTYFRRINYRKALYGFLTTKQALAAQTIMDKKKLDSFTVKARLLEKDASIEDIINPNTSQSLTKQKIESIIEEVQPLMLGQNNWSTYIVCPNGETAKTLKKMSGLFVNDFTVTIRDCKKKSTSKSKDKPTENSKKRKQNDSTNGVKPSKIAKKSDSPTKKTNTETQERKQQEDGEPTDTLRISNLNQQITEEVLKKKFKKATSVYIARDRSGKILGHAVLKFKSVDKAVQVMQEKQGINIQGAPIKITMNHKQRPTQQLFITNLAQDVNENKLQKIFHKATTIKIATAYIQRKPRRCATLSFKSIEHATDAMTDNQKKSVGGRSIHITYHHKKKNKVRGKREHVLVVKNLSDRMTELRLSRIFGEAEGARIPKDDQGKPKGFGFVSFKYAWRAQHVRSKFNGTMLDNKRIEILISKKKNLATPKT